MSINSKESSPVNPPVNLAKPLLRIKSFAPTNIAKLHEEGLIAVEKDREFRRKAPMGKGEHKQWQPPAPVSPH